MIFHDIHRLFFFSCDMKKTHEYREFAFCLLLIIFIIVFCYLKSANATVTTTPADPFLDAFSRFRTSYPTVLFYDTTQFGLNASKWQTLAAGNGSSSYTAGTATLVITTGGSTTGDRFVRQTRYYALNQNRAMLIIMTFAMGSTTSNSAANVGYFDDANGIFFRYANSLLYIVQRSSVTGSLVDTVIAQASWNIDPMDGTGPSGLTLVPTKAQILIIDMIYGGRIRVGFDISGVLYYVHEFLNSNAATQPLLGTASLPGRYEVVNTGAAGGTTTMQTICCSIQSEGGSLVRIGSVFAQSRGATTGPNGSFAPTLCIRARTAIYSGSTQTNHGHFYVNSVSLLNTDGTNPVLYEVLLNPTLTGSSFTDYSSATSIVQYDVTATGISGGTVIVNGFLPASVSGSRGSIASISVDQLVPYVYASLATAVQDTVCVAIYGIGNTAVSVYTTMEWLEDV